MNTSLNPNDALLFSVPGTDKQDSVGSLTNGYAFQSDTNTAAQDTAGAPFEIWVNGVKQTIIVPCVNPANESSENDILQQPSGQFATSSQTGSNLTSDVLSDFVSVPQPASLPSSASVCPMQDVFQNRSIASSAPQVQRNSQQMDAPGHMVSVKKERLRSTSNLVNNSSVLDDNRYAVTTATVPPALNGNVQRLSNLETFQNTAVNGHPQNISGFLPNYRGMPIPAQLQQRYMLLQQNNVNNMFEVSRAVRPNSLRYVDQAQNQMPTYLSQVQLPQLPARSFQYDGLQRQRLTMENLNLVNLSQGPGSMTGQSQLWPGILPARDFAPQLLTIPQSSLSGSNLYVSGHPSGHSGSYVQPSQYGPSGHPVQVGQQLTQTAQLGSPMHPGQSSRLGSAGQVSDQRGGHSGQDVLPGLRPAQLQQLRQQLQQQKQVQQQMQQQAQQHAQQQLQQQVQQQVQQVQQHAQQQVQQQVQQHAQQQVQQQAQQQVHQQIRQQLQQVQQVQQQLQRQQQHMQVQQQQQHFLPKSDTMPTNGVNSMVSGSYPGSNNIRAMPANSIFSSQLQNVAEKYNLLGGQRFQLSNISTYQTVVSQPVRHNGSNGHSDSVGTVNDFNQFRPRILQSGNPFSTSNRLPANCQFSFQNQLPNQLTGTYQLSNYHAINQAVDRPALPQPAAMARQQDVNNYQNSNPALGIFQQFQLRPNGNMHQVTLPGYSNNINELLRLPIATEQLGSMSSDARTNLPNPPPLRNYSDAGINYGVNSAIVSVNSTAPEKQITSQSSITRTIASSKEQQSGTTERNTSALSRKNGGGKSAELLPTRSATSEANKLLANILVSDLPLQNSRCASATNSLVENLRDAAQDDPNSPQSQMISEVISTLDGKSVDIEKWLDSFVDNILCESKDSSNSHQAVQDAPDLERKTDSADTIIESNAVSDPIYRPSNNIAFLKAVKGYNKEPVAPRRKRRKKSGSQGGDSSKSWDPNDYAPSSPSFSLSPGFITDDSSNSSWLSDDSVTIGKKRRRRHKQKEKSRKRKLKSSAGHRRTNHRTLRSRRRCKSPATKHLTSTSTHSTLSCRVLLEKLNLSGRVSVNIGEINEILCCPVRTRNLVESDDESGNLLRSSRKRKRLIESDTECDE